MDYILQIIIISFTLNFHDDLIQCNTNLYSALGREWIGGAAR